MDFKSTSIYRVSDKKEGKATLSRNVTCTGIYSSKVNIVRVAEASTKTDNTDDNSKQPKTRCEDSYRNQETDDNSIQSKSRSEGSNKNQETDHFLIKTVQPLSRFGKTRQETVNSEDNSKQSKPRCEDSYQNQAVRVAEASTKTVNSEDNSKQSKPRCEDSYQNQVVRVAEASTKTDNIDENSKQSKPRCEDSYQNQVVSVKEASTIVKVAEASTKTDDNSKQSKSRSEGSNKNQEMDHFFIKTDLPLSRFGKTRPVPKHPTGSMEEQNSSTRTNGYHKSKDTDTDHDAIESCPDHDDIEIKPYHDVTLMGSEKIKYIHQLNFGDHIFYKRRFGYKHHGIVLEIQQKENKYDIIHYSKNKRGIRCSRKTTVTKETKLFRKSDRMVRYVYGRPVEEETREIAAQRA